MSVSKKGVADMQWWLDNLDESYNDICHPPVDITLYFFPSGHGNEFCNLIGS